MATVLLFTLPQTFLRRLFSDRINFGTDFFLFIHAICSNIFGTLTR